MMMKLLGIDLGTSSLKVLLTDECGNILSRASAAYPLHTPQPGWVEQSPQDWWQAAVSAVRQVIFDGQAISSVDAIGLSGQMHGTVLLDGSGRCLYPAVIWPDQRSPSQVSEIIDQVGRMRWIEIAGSLPATGFQAVTLRWFQQNKHDVWHQVDKVLLPKDYLRWRMCADFTTDPSDAAGTGLMDVGKRCWSPVLLDQLQVGHDLLPDIKPSQEIAGRLIPRAAKELGLPAGIPVVVGAADTAASLLGAGIAAGDDLLLTISTGGQLLTVCNAFQIDPLGRLHTFCSAFEPGDHTSGWYLMGATLSAGQSLRWLRENIFRLDKSEGYDQMITWAEQAAVGAGGLIFSPYLLGERSPNTDQNARGSFVGLSIQHGRPELVRAVLEGVVFSLFEKYLSLVENGFQAGRILLAGGGARSATWSQIVADVFGLPVHRVGIMEQSAYGAALLAGAGIGLFNLAQAVQEWAKIETRIDPDLTTHLVYQDLLALYRQIRRYTNRLSEESFLWD
jgi:xylulokinase